MVVELLAGALEVRPSMALGLQIRKPDPSESSRVAEVGDR